MGTNWEEHMAAYIVFMRERTHNPSELKIYSEKAPAAMEGHAVTPLAVYGRQEVIEGPEVEGAAILEFPTFEEAKAWYDSSAYREAREHRFKGANYRAFIVEGV
jgi:uncharacterized protein (DUF1330 family)